MSAPPDITADVAAPISPEKARPRLCEYCGLPLVVKERGGRIPGFASRFCCYGCYLTQTITGTKAEEGTSVLFLARLGLAAFLAMNAMTLSWALYGDRLSFLFPVETESRQGMSYLIFLLSLPVYLLIGTPFLKHAFMEFSAGNPGVDSLIALGTTAAFLYSVYSTFTGSTAVYYDTATMVLVLVTVGRYLEASARLKTSIALRNLFSPTAINVRVVRGDGEETLPVGMVGVGELVRVLPGEEIPVDGRIVEGETSVDESVLTGESAPLRKSMGDVILGGSTNYDGSVLFRTTCVARDTVLARLTRMMEEVQQARSPLQLTAEKITKIFVPSVISLALLSGIFWGIGRGATSGLLQGLSVLLIACPCALGLGSTLAGFIGYAVAARRGILLKSVSVLEASAEVNAVLFDKTGTLTNGKLRVIDFVPGENTQVKRDTILAYASSLEARSEHPVGIAIRAYAREHGLASGAVIWSKTHIGRGIEGEVSLIGKGKALVKILKVHKPRNHTSSRDISHIFTESYIEIDNINSGTFILEDDIRPSAYASVSELIRDGLDVTVVSGDSSEAVQIIGSILGISHGLHGSLSPTDKLKLINELRQSGAQVAMIGDGINDSPAIAAATIGITLRSGTDLSKIAADVTVMDDDLTNIPWLFSYAKRVRRTIRWNFTWAFAYNIAGVGLALGGMLEPVVAAGAMVLSSTMVILNSTRLSR